MALDSFFEDAEERRRKRLRERIVSLAPDQRQALQRIRDTDRLRQAREIILSRKPQAPAPVRRDDDDDRGSRFGFDLPDVKGAIKGALGRITGIGVPADPQPGGRKTELDKRNLGFLVEPPRLGLNFPKIGEVWSEEISDIFENAKRGDIGDAAYSGLQLFGRNLQEFIVRPSDELAKAGGAAVGNASYEFSTRVLGAPKFEDNPDYYSGQDPRSDPGYQFKAGLAFESFLPALQGARSLKGLAFEAIYPGGVLEGATSIARGLASTPGAALSAAREIGTQASYKLGTQLEEAAPGIAEVLRGPMVRRYNAGEAVPQWPRITYEQPDGTAVTGLRINRDYLQNLINVRRREYFASQKKYAAGEVPREGHGIPEDLLPQYKYHTDALQRLFQAMTAMKTPEIVVKEGNLYKFANQMSDYLKAVSEEGVATLEAVEARKVASKFEQMLFYVPEYTPQVSPRRFRLGETLRRAFTEENVDPEYYRGLRELHDSQQELKGIEDEIAAALEQRSQVETDIGQMFDQLKAKLPVAARRGPAYGDWVTKVRRLGLAEDRVNALEAHLRSRFGMTAEEGAESVLKEKVLEVATEEQAGKVPGLSALAAARREFRKASAEAQKATDALRRSLIGDLDTKVDAAQARVNRLKEAVVRRQNKGGSGVSYQRQLAKAEAELAQLEVDLAYASKPIDELKAGVTGLQEHRQRYREITEGMIPLKQKQKDLRKLTVERKKLADAGSAKARKSTAKVLRQFRDTLFRPADTADDGSAPYYALDGFKVIGSSDDPAGYTLAAVLTPMSPAGMGEELRRMTRLQQLQENADALRAELRNMPGGPQRSAKEAELLELEKQIKADLKTIAAKDTQGEGALEARQRLKEANRKAADKLSELQELRRKADPKLADEIKRVEGELQQAREAVRDAQNLRKLIPEESKLYIPLGDVDRKFVRYRLAPVKKAAVKDRKVRDESFRVLQQKIQAVTSDIEATENKLRADEANLKFLQSIRDATDRPTYKTLFGKGGSKQPLDISKTDRAQAAIGAKTLERRIEAHRVSLEGLQERHETLLDDMARLNQERYAKANQSRNIRDRAEERLAQASAEVARARQSLDETMLPVTPTTKNVRGETVAILPANRGETVVQWRAKMAQRAHDRFLEQIRGLEGKPILSQEELDHEVRVIRDAYQFVKDTKFARGLGKLTQQFEKTAPNLSTVRALEMLLAPWEFYSEAGDVRSWSQVPIAGWIRRTLLGTGLLRPDNEGLMATFFNMENTAAFHAKATFGDLYQQVGQAITDILRQSSKGEQAFKAADAPQTLAGRPANFVLRNILGKHDHNRVISEYLRRHAKKIDSPEWNAIWRQFDAYGEDYKLSDELKQLVYDYVSRDFTMAALNPKLFSDRLHPTIKQYLSAYQRSYANLRETARIFYGVNPSSASSVRFELRQRYGPRGILQSLRDDVGPVKIQQRNEITDLIETARLMEVESTRPKLWMLTNEGLPSAVSRRLPGGSRTFPMTLDRIYSTGQDKAEGLPAAIYRAMNEKEWATRVRGRLAVGAQPARNPGDGPTEFTDSLKDQNGQWQEIHEKSWKGSARERRQMAADWKKMTGMLQRDEPSGIWKVADQFRRVFNTIGLSVLIGDASIVGIQMPFLMALNPRAGMRVLTNFLHVGGPMWSDVKFSAYTAANRDILELAVSRGLGLGLEAYTGASWRSGSMWEHLPLTRPFGRGAKYVNDIMFNRMMMMMKLEAIKTNMHVAQVLKAVPPAVAAPYLDQLPGLNRIHKDTDILQSTEMDVFDAIIRVTNNQFGGVPRSQSQLGLWREFVEHGTLIVPGFFRARAGLINQASRALKNPGSVEGYLALNIMLKEMMYTQMLAGGIATATGNLDAFLQTRKDPRKAEFWGTPLGPSGEFVRTAPSPAAAQLYTRLVAGLDEIEDPKERLSVTKLFFRNRTHPALAAIQHQIEGKDFFGNNRTDVRNRAIMGLQDIAPVWLSELGAGLEDQVYSGDFNLQALAADTGLEFIGMTHRPANRWDELNNRFIAWQARNYPDREPVSWDMATSDLKDMARQDDPEIMHREQLWSIERSRQETDKNRAAEAVFTRFEENNAALDAASANDQKLAEGGVISFEDWKDRHHDIGQQRSQYASQLRDELIDLGIDIEASSKEKLQNMQINGMGPLVALALAEYKAVELPRIQKEYIVDGEKVYDTVLDFDSFNAERQRVLSGYPQSIQDEVLKKMGPRDEMEARYDQARVALDTYLEQMPKYQNASVAEGNYIDFVVASLKQIDRRVRQEGIAVTRKRLFLLGLSKMAKDGYITNRRQIELAARAYAYALDSDERTKARTPESLRFIADNPDILRFFPWFRSEVPHQMWRFLPEDTRAQVDIPGLLERELGDAGVSSIG